MATEMPKAEFFNPHQVRIERFSQTRVDRSGQGGSDLFRYEITLRLGEARGPHFAVQRLTLEAEGASMERETQHSVLRMFLDAVSAALEREKAGARPGTP